MRKNLLSFMVFCLAAVSAIAAEPLLFGPYIQNVKTNEATVVWVTAGSTVTLSTGEQQTQREAYNVHTVRFAHLNPATSYTYTLDGEMKGAFITAPEDAADFRFVAYGDTRSAEEQHAAVVAAIRQVGNSAFVINTGDLVSRGAELENWKSFFRVAQPLMAETWYVPCLGNHEDNAQEYFDFFVLPGNESWYSFNWAGVHFAVLNTEPPDPPDGMEESAERDLLESKMMWDFLLKQRRWLNRDLKQNRFARFLVVVFHVPYYDTKLSRREPQDEVRRAFADVLEKYEVELVLNGHTHNYQHHKKGFTHYVITGGGGAPLYDIEETVGVEGVETIAQEKTLHFCIFDVVGHRINARALRPDGTEIDIFSIESRSGPRSVSQRLQTLRKTPSKGRKSRILAE